MFDRNKMIECRNLTFGELKEELNKLDLPDDCEILFNGDNYGYIHVEKDNSAMSFDDSSLDDLYDDCK